MPHCFKCIYVTDYNEISIMKYPIVSLHCFHVVSLSIAEAFEPLIGLSKALGHNPSVSLTIMIRQPLQPWLGPLKSPSVFLCFVVPSLVFPVPPVCLQLRFCVSWRGCGSPPGSAELPATGSSRYPVCTPASHQLTNLQHFYPGFPTTHCQIAVSLLW